MIYNKVISVIVENSNGEVLLGTRLAKSYIGSLQTPGGSIEGYETLEEAAIRETKEETGLDIEYKEYIGYVNIPSTIDIGVVNIFYVVVCRTKENENIQVPTNEMHKCNDWAWYNLDKLPDLTQMTKATAIAIHNWSNRTPILD